jgi:drug/metabolite transporter (DMT)-like permease
MNDADTTSVATERGRKLDADRVGFLYGFLGILSFSLTLPMTRLAVADLDPTFVGLGRAIVAALLSAILLAATRQKLPTRDQIIPLAVVALGVVVGFPFLSAWAMRRLPASHGAIVVGLVPLATAVAGAIRAGERPSRRFWIAGVIGSGVVVGFALLSGAGSLEPADLALLGAVIAAAIGYAEGGRLARTMGGWRVICWALILAAPFLAIPVTMVVVEHGLHAGAGAWLGFGYVSGVSMFLGFFAWYHGLALGGIARVGQLQLLQTFLTITASALILGEKITLLMLVVALLVVVIVAIGRS